MRKIDVILAFTIYLATDFIFDTAFRAVLKYGMLASIAAWIIFQLVKLIVRKNLKKGVNKMLDKILHATKRKLVGIPLGVLSGLGGILALLGVIPGASTEAITLMFTTALTAFGVASSVQAKVVDAVDKLSKKTNKEIIKENDFEIEKLEKANEELAKANNSLDVQINSALGIATLDQKVKAWQAELAENLKSINVNNATIAGLKEMSEKLATV